MLYFYVTSILFFLEGENVTIYLCDLSVLLNRYLCKVQEVHSQCIYRNVGHIVMKGREMDLFEIRQL